MSPGSRPNDEPNLISTRNSSATQERSADIRLKAPSFLKNIARTFSLKQRFVFFLIVFGLGTFSIAAWWSVKSSVENTAMARLNAEADRIELAIEERMNTFANSLLHLRGHLAQQGAPSKKTFSSYLESLEIPLRYPGVVGIGLTALKPTAKGEAQQAPLLIIEPSDWPSRDIIGFDLLSTPEKRNAALRSAATGLPTLTSLVDISLSTPNADAEELDTGSKTRGRSKGLILFLPLQKTTVALGKTKESQAPFSNERLPEHPSKQTEGFIFASLRAHDVFDGLFGSPSLKDESINFSVRLAQSDTDENSPNSTVYDRFGVSDAQAEKWLTIERRSRIMDREFVIRFIALPHFFTWSERHLATTVGFGAAFLSILILLVLKSSQNQLRMETRAKEFSLASARRSRQQIETLKRLNDFAKHISVELDFDRLASRFFKLVDEVCKAQAAALYLAPDYGAVRTSFRLTNSRSIAADHISHSSLDLAESMALLPQSKPVRRGDPGATEALVRLFRNPPHFSDWLLIAIPSPEIGRCGILFVARTDGTNFEELEIELLESLVAQSAAAIENARLFRRVDDASRAKNAFLANMSHEIRTPLNAIIGFSEILTKSDLPDSQKETLTRNIRKGSTQLTRLIDDILDFSKIEAGELVTERKRVSVLGLIEDLKAVMEPKAREKRVELLVESSGLVPSHVMTDEVRLKQILSNLVGNAIKFTETGSVVVQLRASNQDAIENSIAFRIKDTGLGISSEAQFRLFEPFSPGDDSSTRRFGGSGLGLAIARRLCFELGGDLELLESTPGKGSTFEAVIDPGSLADVEWVEVTQAPPRYEAETERLSPIVPVLDGARILLVEDSPDNQDIFRFFLEAAQAHVDVVDNGLDAVRMAASQHYDMILMDIQIPEIDGKEATRRIRHHGFVRPIVALTAHALDEEKKSCIAAGCDDQITKPVSGEKLISEVAMHLRRTYGRESAVTAYS